MQLHSMAEECNVACSPRVLQVAYCEAERGGWGKGVGEDGVLQRWMMQQLWRNLPPAAHVQAAEGICMLSRHRRRVQVGMRGHMR